MTMPVSGSFADTDRADTFGRGKVPVVEAVGKGSRRSATPRISVVMPVLNEQTVIRASLERLTELQDWVCEVVVVDGGSMDATREIAAGFAIARLIHAERGRARQMNAGADVVTGDVLLFLHADTLLPRAAVEELAQAMQSGAEWGRFAVRFDRQPGRSERLLAMVAKMMNLRSCLTAVATGDQGLFFRRAFYQRIGGFPDIALMEDIAISKIARKQARIRCLKTPLTTSARRWRERGVWRTILLMWWMRLAYFFGVSPASLNRWYR